MIEAPSLLGTLRALRSASRAEDAIQRCLHAILDAVRPHAGHRLLRASLHLRPTAGHAGLYVLEASADAISPPRADHRLMPSLTAWHHARATGRPVLVDVVQRTLHAVGDAAPTAARIRPRAESPMSAASQMRLLGRDATHVCVLPVTTVGDAIGTVAVEVADLAGVGTDSVWPACVEALELIVALAAPMLAGLPPAEVDGPPTDPLLPVIGPTMAPVVRVADAFAREDETLLIVGETGTGKSRLARWCHARSPRADGPFEVLDLLGVPQETQMGELFGWRRGAFTGAVSDHDGFVTRASGGTLFIDEIDKLSLDAQAGLLGLLEDRSYRVLGDRGGARRADVRFIVGTNADLRAAVQQGRFREDLLYRLDVLSVELPPLRERADEIGDWARYMLAARQGEASEARISADALAALRSHDWPGNLRELSNTLRRACVLAGLDADGGALRITADHLGLRRASPSRPPPAPARPVTGGALARVADAHAALVEALARSGPAPDDLDVGGALYGALLAEAVAHFGDRAEAFALVGSAGLVRNRNHHRVLRREAGRFAALARHLDEPVPAAVEAIVGDD